GPAWPHLRPHMQRPHNPGGYTGRTLPPPNKLADPSSGSFLHRAEPPLALKSSTHLKCVTSDAVGILKCQACRSNYMFREAPGCRSQLLMGPWDCLCARHTRIYETNSNGM